MNENIYPSELQRAVAFFHQRGLERFLRALREKYIEVGHAGGTVILRDSTPSERKEVVTLLGKPAVQSEMLKISLQAFDEALRKSGFACTLHDLLVAFFPHEPLIPRKEQRAKRTELQGQFLIELKTIAMALSNGSRGQHWLIHGAHGIEWLFSRYKRLVTEHPEQQGEVLSTIHYVAYAVNQLPEEGSERLSLFAQRTSGDPHSLDRDREAGRIFLYALADLFFEGTDLPTDTDQADLSDQYETLSASMFFLQDGEGRQQLYLRARLHLDGISSYVTVFNLAGAIFIDGHRDPLLEVAHEQIQIFPLRRINTWQQAFAAQPRIYVVENPQVFEELVDGWLEDAREQTYKPTIICTSGWPSVAALKLLSLLLAQPENELYYSGDFDLKGLQIATYLIKRYARQCHPWRFDVEAYATALQAGGTLVQIKDISALQKLVDLFPSLVEAIQRHEIWAYQEGIAHLLASDFIACNHY